jgi:hypothetical protein
VAGAIENLAFVMDSWWTLDPGHVGGENSWRGCIVMCITKVRLHPFRHTQQSHTFHAPPFSDPSRYHEVWFRLESGIVISSLGDYKKLLMPRH